ncbi:MAG: type II toxin-antitoxin system RatA family toxin [Alphaproteobacteria bacterium]|nr:type II toxin-antitoxin system RatA family toxin [Alphaproteobacteria bacterium]
MPRHEETQFIPHKPKDLYDLVCDVEQYPEFLPWCQAVRIRKRLNNVIYADLVAGFKSFNEKYTSKVTFDAENLTVDVEYEKGPFKHLINRWRFHEKDGGCEIDFFIDFEFKSKLLQSVANMVFREAFQKMVAAFSQRADEIYGKSL